MCETDARGFKTVYEVDELTSRNKSVTDRMGAKTCYEYDEAGNVKKVINKNSDGIKLANVSYSYDMFGNLNEIVRGDGLKYHLTYTAFNELEAIKIDGKADNLISYTYNNGSGNLKKMTYANGDRMTASYNGKGQMIAEIWYDKNETVTAYYKYAYDFEGNIVRSIDILNLREYNYSYENGKLMSSSESFITLKNELVTAKILLCSQYFCYDDEDKLTKKIIKFIDGSERIVSYETNEENTISKLLVNGKTVMSHSKNDSFGRKVFDELQLGSGFVSRQFSYHTGEFTDEHKDNEKLKSSPTTQLVSQITFDDGRTIEYEYDAEERITKVTDSLDGVTEYTYDALGQLTTETKNGTVVNTIAYDNYGNIVQKNGIQYFYDDVWKDKLTKIGADGDKITYDAQGNPTKYRDFPLTWEKGRQLASFDSNVYTYNANGIRISKTINNIRHDFILDGAKILRETWNGNTLDTIYDNEDNVCGIIFNNAPYYFLKNLQGDIIAVANENGDTVARYTYDAWGKCTIHHTSLNATIADINPYRYRGYYFDSEIGMYYLQSRYYDPEVGRFVNGDEPTFATMQGNVLQHNLFAYCGNDVVNRSDDIGFASYKVALAVQSPVSLNSTVAFNFKNLSAGHTYIELFKDGKRICTRGFLSATTSTMLVALSRITFNGKIRNEPSLSRSISVSYNINRKQYDKIYNYLYQTKPPKYNVITYNCTTFAIGALEKAGIKHHFKKHFWNMGKGFYITVGSALVIGGLTMIYKSKIVGMAIITVASLVLSFSLSYGYYPARLAYDIAHGVR